MTAQVCWIFSLARCGSSIAAYAAAAPWQVPVADEPFGPWDRTRPPYQYPPEQRQLKDLYWKVGEHLTPEVEALATTLFDKIAGPANRVVSKHPHDMIKPHEFRAVFPEHRSVYLLRHPLVRLNSLYARGWHKAIGPDFDLPRFKLVAGWWLDHPHRFTYEELRADPASFYRRVWSAWGWDFDPSHVERALAYQRDHYHASSRELGTQSPGAPLSESTWALPDEAAERYLADPFVREVMAAGGWTDDLDALRKRGSSVAG
ncbi:MAG: hypothetical protein ACF8SC_03145 [Phycisphaerales bacterium JB037]